MSSKIKFISSTPSNFFPIVKQRVDEYFESKGISRHGNWRMYLKTGFFIGVLVTAYLLLLFANFRLHGVLAMWAILGFVCAFIGVNICHDAIHGSYSKSTTLNKGLGYLFNLIGANAYMWSITHNVVHHTYTNIEGHDEDLESVPVLRLSPAKPKMKIHRFQHFYAFFPAHWDPKLRIPRGQVVAAASIVSPKY